MKKILLAFPIVALFAAGCDSSQQTYNPNPAQSPIVQSTNRLPTSTPTATPATTPTTPTPTPTNLSINISQFNPDSGPIGSEVTITGTGFTATGNIVNFGPGATISNLNSPNGSILQFTVPSRNNPPKCPPNSMCAPLRIYSGPYKISIINANGSSNSKTFTVTQ